MTEPRMEHSSSPSELTPEAKQRLLQVYQELKSVLETEKLPSGARASTEQALSAMWQVVNGLGLEYEFLYDLGV